MNKTHIRMNAMILLHLKMWIHPYLFIFLSFMILYRYPHYVDLCIFSHAFVFIVQSLETKLIIVEMIDTLVTKSNQVN